MKRMTKQELIESITEYETLLNNKAKIRKFKNFTIGAFIVHLAKLKQELKTITYNTGFLGICQNWFYIV